MNRRSREVGFIFIAAIRRDSTPGVVVGSRGRQGPTSLGQSVAVVIINDATSNATSPFSPPSFLFLSFTFSSPLFFIVRSCRRLVTAASFRFSVVSCSRTRSEIHDRLRTLPGVRRVSYNSFSGRCDDLKTHVATNNRDSFSD